MSAKVSVVVPVYNMELHLEKCLESLLTQTMSDIEVIAVDDGSVDDSASILARYAKRDSRIRLVDQPNSGLAAARNRGIHAASGEFIGFVDSDDYVDPDMFGVLFDKAVADQSDVAICQFREVSPEGKVRRTSNIEVQADKDDYFRNILSAKDSSMACNKIFHRRLFVDRNIRFPVGLLHEDVPTIYRLIYFAGSVSVVPIVGYNWVRRGGSISKSVSFKHVLDLMWGLSLTLQFLEEEGVVDDYWDCFTRRSVHYTVGAVERMRRDHPEHESSVWGLVEVWLNMLGVNSEAGLRALKSIDEELYRKYQPRLSDDVADRLSAQILQGKLAQAERRLDMIEESFTYQLARKISGLGVFLLPEGSRRKRLVMRAAARLRTQ
jgi:glycosyltransferase involved in cell wall biosynthesis